MSTADLRDESGVKDRTAFTRALDELQAAMLVVPSQVFYHLKHRATVDHKIWGGHSRSSRSWPRLLQVASFPIRLARSMRHRWRACGR